MIKENRPRRSLNGSVRYNPAGRHGPQYKYKLGRNTVIVDVKTGRVITVFSDAEAVPGVKPQGYIVRD